MSTVIRHCVSIAFMLLLLCCSGAAQILDTIPPPSRPASVGAFCQHGNTHWALHTECVSSQSLDNFGYLYRSTDDGAVWERVESLPVLPTVHFRLQHDGGNGLYYAMDTAVFHSSDDGFSWTNITRSAPVSSRLYFYMHMTGAPGTSYILHYWEGLLHTSDTGRSWKKRTLPRCTLDERLSDLHLAYAGNALFAWFGKRDTLYRSTDAGNTWESYLTGEYPMDVIDGGNGSVLLSCSVNPPSGPRPMRILSQSAGVTTWDTLASWIRPMVNGTAVKARSSLVRFGSDVLALLQTDSLGAPSILISRNGGRDWTDIVPDVSEDIASIAFDASGRVLIYGPALGLRRLTDDIGGSEQLFYTVAHLNGSMRVDEEGNIAAVSELNGTGLIHVWKRDTKSWHTVPDVKLSAPFNIAYLAPDTLIAPTPKLSRSSDLGAHWSPLLPDQIRAIGGTGRPHELFAASYRNTYVSTDDGWTWKQLGLPVMYHIPTFIAASDGVFYVKKGSSAQLWRKNERDGDWDFVSAPYTTADMVGGENGLLYVLDRDRTRIDYTSDRGESWTPGSRGFGKAHVLLPHKGDTLVVLDTTRGLVISPNRGASWSLVDLHSHIPRTVASRSGELYVGTQNDGVLVIRTESFPVAVKLHTPVSGVECLPSDVRLAWSSPRSAGPFRVRCANEVGMWPHSIKVDTLVYDTTMVLRHWPPGSKCYWTADVEDSSTQAMKTAPSDFRVAPLPYAMMTNPPMDAQCHPLRGTLDFVAQECALYSELELTRDSSFQTVDWSWRVGGDVSSVPFAVNESARYYARVRSETASGLSPWSTTRTFSTVADTLPAPQLHSPLNNSIVQYDDSLQWNPVDCATHYIVLFSLTEDFAEIFYRVSRSEPYRYILISWPFGKSGEYYWKVQAFRGNAAGYYSETRVFTLHVPVAHSTSIANPSGVRIESIHPMPVFAPRDPITIEYSSASIRPMEVILTDILGRECLRRQVDVSSTDRQSLMLDASSLPGGRYILRLRQGELQDFSILTVLR